MDARYRSTTLVGRSWRAMLVVTAFAMLMSAPPGALAGRPDTVDPAIMQPALNPAFAPWDCWRSGAGIVCVGQKSESYANEPTPLVCDGRTVYVSGSDVRTLRRIGDADGLALRTTQHVMISDVMTLTADGSGPAIYGGARYQEHYEYLVPGDISSRTDRYTGWDTRAIAPGIGLIVHDVGTKTFDIDDNVLDAHGPHPLLDDFFGSIGKLCDAFADLQS